MAEPAVATPLQPRQTLQPMQVAIKGRIEASRMFNGNRYTRITTPAADQYSRPQTVEIRSKGKLGEKGEEATVMATLGGFTRRPYQTKDNDSGEIVTITPVDLTLDAIE
ncbi:single-stranded DNA-binding protein [Oxalicibacterium faecigallinarum]|uniref:Single-stranded DNA-binding protein n=1 Tax=Oxalicibacterium faecigallinarum TaxID=573741 RepID=A0A8J3AZW8_9BURK|nr:single-stranded DNA-binding protein [Oxalicibacterium faecigallinarum]GGI21077.1 hypothetical protein GCM10008066_27260 [Oxalicibacterium faecigallinarum]